MSSTEDSKEQATKTKSETKLKNLSTALKKNLQRRKKALKNKDDSIQQALTKL